MRTVIINGEVWLFTKAEWARFIDSWQSSKQWPDPSIYGRAAKQELEDITGWKSLDVSAEYRRINTSGLVYCSVGPVPADAGDTK
jgi:hypothetical protein